MNADLLTEYDDRSTVEIETDTYRQLEWVRIERLRKPGWTKVMFREWFGHWPDDWLKGLEPSEPCERLLKLIRRADNKYKREMKKADGNRVAKANP